MRGGDKGEQRRSPRTRTYVTTNNRVLRCIGLFWLLYVPALVLSPTRWYSYSNRIVEVYHSILVNALVGVEISRRKVSQRPRR
jgi:hypothetical protein